MVKLKTRLDADQIAPEEGQRLRRCTEVVFNSNTRLTFVLAKGEFLYS